MLDSLQVPGWFLYAPYETQVKPQQDCSKTPLTKRPRLPSWVGEAHQERHFQLSLAAGMVPLSRRGFARSAHP